MVVDIIDFIRNFLNPLLKTMVMIFFALGTVMFYQAYARYGGNLKKIAYYLMWSGFAGTVAAAFRWMGDIFEQWKWGETTFLFLFALISILVSFVVFSYLMEIAIIFGMVHEEE